MGSLYRSEHMRFCQMILEKEAAFNCIAEVGKHPYVQFKDLNAEVNNFQRVFVKDIRRFEELERKLRFLDNEIRRADIDVPDYNDPSYEVINQQAMNELENTLNDLERDVNQMSESKKELQKTYNGQKEWEAVLEKTDQFFAGGVDDAAREEIEHQVEDDDGIQLKGEKESIGYSIGVIETKKVNSFERVLWRAGRRTAFLRHAEIEDLLESSEGGEKVSKSVFIVFYNGNRLKNIVDKVCDGFKATQYNNCPRTAAARAHAAHEVKARIQDLRTVLGQTNEHNNKVLNAAAGNINQWMTQVKFYKSIYYTLNLFTFDGIGKFMVAECWVPLDDITNVRQALEDGAEKNGATVKPVLNILETHETPPTYNRTNKFTAVFQGIVDSYGIADYLEVNPAPYTIITFPFIFSCMFGDLGHGIIMFLAGLYLVLREKNLIARNIKDEIFGMFFGGRYIILLMGLFSIYAGFLYNDMFAKSFNIFGSSWRNPYTNDSLESWISQDTGGHGQGEMKLELPPQFAYLKDNGPYPMGVDPIWNLADNKLNYLNSMKMKLSIIVGIAQMTFGVFLSLQNHRYFESKIDIYTVFIPQLLFMACIFMYLCLQIILKWLFFWVTEETIFGQLYPGSHCAPSLLIGLINMFMFKDRESGFVNMNKIITTEANGHIVYEEKASCFLQQWYPGQSIIEAILVIIAVICVPIMLFGKPVYILMQQKKAKKAISDSMSVRMNAHTDEAEVISNGKVIDDLAPKGGHGGHHDENFGDIMVHQAIHTIEYVLGCVSHTASYLRLWALSLAHAQLSEVLWEMILENAWAVEGTGGVIAAYVIFFFFGILSVSILVLMEGLSAFLHALRLHWVEFQSKFYIGTGIPFLPFHYKTVLNPAE
uniref:V-type proton ATPase subunit a n=1 Tax=Parastrongyloides trichosuri TaxID=131310 RepID=A0A0N4ZHW6_PARTI